MTHSLILYRSIRPDLNGSPSPSRSCYSAETASSACATREKLRNTGWERVLVPGVATAAKGAAAGLLGRVEAVAARVAAAREAAVRVVAAAVREAAARVIEAAAREAAAREPAARVVKSGSAGGAMAMAAEGAGMVRVEAAVMVAAEVVGVGLVAAVVVRGAAGAVLVA